MRRSKMRIQLKPSKAMSTAARKDAKEHGYIRLPAPARNYYQAQGTRLEITAGPENSAVLEIKPALKVDVAVVKGDKDRNRYGFVTEKIYDKINLNAKLENIWVSEHVDNLIVGSDPEFGLIVPATGEMLYAQHIPGIGNRKASLGHDGPCMELRPAQSDSVAQHCKNIKDLFKNGSLQNNINKYNWCSAATYQQSANKRRYTMGGHIHIGEPSMLKDYIKGLDTYERPGKREALNRRLIRVLDELVGLPLTKIDGPNADWRRTKATYGPYGTFGDYRKKDGRVEWRTPSAVWLCTPDLATATLTTTKAVAEDFYHRVSEKSFDNKWVSAPVTANGLLKELGCSPDATVKKILHGSKYDCLSSEELSSLHGKLRSLSQYKKYKDEIDMFISLTSMDEKQASEIPVMKTKENWLS